MRRWIKRASWIIIGWPYQETSYPQHVLHVAPPPTEVQRDAVKVVEVLADERVYEWWKSAW